MHSCLNYITKPITAVTKTLVSSTRLSSFIPKMKCYLVCNLDTHDPIPLPHGETVVLGRSPLTRIKDPRCSREQVELTANCKSCTVTVRQKGSNSTAAGDEELSQGQSTSLNQNGILYILKDHYPHVVKFIDDGKTDNSASSKLNSEKQDESYNMEKIKQGKKRSLSTESDSSSRKKIKSDHNHSKQRNEVSDNTGKKMKHEPNQLKRKHEKPISDNDDVECVEKKLKKMREDAAKDASIKEKHTPKRKESPKSDSVVHVSKGPALESRWTQHEKLHIYTKKGVEGRKKIASFDIDGTIITTQSGKKFPTHVGDWKIHYPEIPGRLKKLHNEGYKIVFITNQMGVERGKSKLEDMKTKFTSLTEKIPAPIQLFMSTGSGWYRKPALGMWRYLVNKVNDGVPVNIHDSFYVGDAAGRPEKWAPKKKKDFSCGDRLFALNVGIKFYTPEEFFFNEKKAQFSLPDYDPRKIKSNGDLLDPPNAKLILGKQEVVVMVGIPASGKSHFAKSYFVPKDYAYVNRDTLGTWQKCVAACDRGLKNGSSVVVDNTNPDPDSRKRYIDVAKKNKVACRCFFIPPLVAQSRHNERFRELVDKSHQAINDMIMNTAVKKMQPPNVSEGFDEVVKVNFIPMFNNPDHEKLYKIFLMEK